jgi:hypothetical protein
MLVQFFCFVAKGQDSTSIRKTSNWDVSLEGMIGVSFGNNFYSMNVGGPSLFLNLNKDWKIGVGALPSLYVLNGKLGARLGVSPRIDYKNLVLIAPFFHRDTVDEWIWSVGFGYKFHKKK